MSIGSRLIFGRTMLEERLVEEEKEYKIKTAHTLRYKLRPSAPHAHDIGLRLNSNIGVHQRIGQGKQFWF